MDLNITRDWNTATVFPPDESFTSQTALFASSAAIEADAIISAFSGVGERKFIEAELLIAARSSVFVARAAA